MNNWETVIGIEVHVELNTKTKMFCRCSADYLPKEDRREATDFVYKPNTHTCPVCLGLPGVLPFINEEAIKKCIQIGLALGCSVNDQSHFERKNYFYPDLAKGYQISQLVKPLNINGQLTLDNGKVIRINRAHQEEDTGKLTHTGGETLVDFNRSGVPLVEIVTEPDFRNSEEVRDYAKKLQQIFKHIGVSNADMEWGDMRLEANVSVRKIASSQTSRNDDLPLPPYRVELKNINSFRFMVAAIEFEVKRQITALENGEKLTQETRGWNEDKKETYLQRSKEEAHDYRYFPEPDLPQLSVDSFQFSIEEIKKQMTELPEVRITRYQEEFSLSKQQAAALSGSKGLAEFFEKTVDIGKQKDINALQVANYIINRKIDINEVLPENIISEITGKSEGVISDEGELQKIVKEVIKENEKSVADYRSGKETALQSLIGGVMRKTSGKADAGKVAQILRKELE